MLAVAALLVTVCISAHEHERRADKQQQKTERIANRPVAAAGNLTTAHKQAQADNQADPAADRFDWRGGLVRCFRSSGAADWGLLGIGIIGVFYGIKTLKALEGQTEIAQASVNALKSAERAYIRISYRLSADDGSPNVALGFHEATNSKTKARAPAGTVAYRLDIRITNSGNTMAKVEGGVIQRALNHPDVAVSSGPPDEDQIFGTVLHRGDWMRRKLTYFLSETDIALKEKGLMWLVGYVDYWDKFGTKHRAAFGRHVQSGGFGKNNLEIDSASRDYNDDYEIDENGNRKKADR